MTSAEITSEQVPAIRLECKAFFENPGFITWLERPGTATWHLKGQPPSELSDAFLHYAGPEEGSDFPDIYAGNDCYPGIPEAIYHQIADAVEAQFGDRHCECLVWLVNS